MTRFCLVFFMLSYFLGQKQPWWWLTSLYLHYSSCSRLFVVGKFEDPSFLRAQDECNFRVRFFPFANCVNSDLWKIPTIPYFVLDGRRRMHFFKMSHKLQISGGEERLFGGERKLQSRNWHPENGTRAHFQFVGRCSRRCFPHFFSQARLYSLQTSCRHFWPTKILL